jgi:4-amino-4-deoxy-L-arabinose transferase-like glycosyltransferase
VRTLSNRDWRWAASGVAVLAVGVRGAALLATPHYRPIHDDHAYAHTAATLLEKGRYPVSRVADGSLEPSAYRPPGWPVLLAGIWRLTGQHLWSARLLLVLLGAATCVLGAVIARKLWGDLPGLAAGMLLALDPLLVATGATLESETLFTLLVVGAVAAALYARDRPRPYRLLAVGALAGLAALTRTNGLVLIPVVACLAVPPHWRWRSVAAVLTTILVAAAVIAPWTVRNAVHLHRFVPVSTETGNTLAGMYNTTSLRHHARWLEPGSTGAYRHLYRRLRGSALDAALVPAVGRWVCRHPTYPLTVLAWNGGRLLGFDGPGWAAESLRTMSLGNRGATLVWLGTLAITLAALAGIWRAARDGATPKALLAMPLALFLPVALVNGEMRLGVPLQAILAILAAAAFRRRSARGAGRPA